MRTCVTIQSALTSRVLYDSTPAQEGTGATGTNRRGEVQPEAAGAGLDEAGRSAPLRQMVPVAPSLAEVRALYNRCRPQARRRG